VWFSGEVENARKVLPKAMAIALGITVIICVAPLAVGGKKYTRFECIFQSSPLVSWVFFIFSTRFECIFPSSPLVSSVFS
jgi:hypothetical protein